MSASRHDVGLESEDEEGSVSQWTEQRDGVKAGRKHLRLKERRKATSERA